MMPADKPAFLAVLVGLASMKPGKPLTDEGLELFWHSMQDWAIDEFKAAAVVLNKTCEFMPSAYDFEQLRKASRPTAGEAFVKARAAMRAAMPSQFPSLSCGDPLIDKAIRACGGYEALAMTNTENIGFFERRFAEHFEAASYSHEIRQALPFLGDPNFEGLRRINQTRPNKSLA